MAAKKEQLKIEFTKREMTGKGVCRKIRTKSLVPVILYGPEYKQGLPGTVSLKAIAGIANSKARETTLIELSMPEGKTCSALIRDVQRHPLSQLIRHIDFYQVLKGHKIKVEIPIRVINTELSIGVKEGGMLNQSLRLVAVEIQPSDIPEEIIVDAKDLEMGAEIFVKDLQLPKGSEWLSSPETIVLHILQPRTVSDEDTLEENAEKEIEVVAKGKANKEE